MTVKIFLYLVNYFDKRFAILSQNRVNIGIIAHRKRNRVE